ncbi:hypothetical protein GQ607_015727 [Colletotrichum asianum]|uniref:Heterokaryon incompatibility domain-containing protein n=1 Tax=Colletotrichum asianum TaxID=702518 RepID=A0A8H3W0H7_9PEZI|nr:hypothetical protein GQ607_015727 [Colletotrichum asianum]
MPRYQYKPLGQDQLRILKLFPGEFDDPLWGRLDHCRFDPPHTLPTYEALSYAWGNQDNPETLTLVGNSLVLLANLTIGQNLASALRDLRSTSEARSIWCDAVCINQQDLPERAVQVKRMADIYRYADRVVAWLDSENERITHAFHLLDEFGSYIRYDIGLAKRYTHKGMSTTYMENDYLLPLSVGDWKCVIDLVRLPWFMRLWVRQEIILANPSAALASGRHRLLWSRAYSAIAYFDHKLKREETVVKAAQRPQTTAISNYMMKLIECQDSTNSALDIVALMQDCECADPRDRVYGTLGLQKDLNIRIDYSKTVEEVYLDWTLAYCRKFSRLRVLELCEMASKPSWVPNLAKPVTLRLSRTQARSAANTISFFKVLTDKSCMMLAIRYGTIRRHTSAMPHEPDIQAMQNTLKSWTRDILSLRGTRSDFKLAMDNLATTISGGRAKEYYDHARFNTSQVKTALLPSSGESSSSSNTEQSTIFPPLFYDLIKILPNAAVFATDDVQFGLGSSAASVDDEIWVVLGFRFPVVMRRVEDSKYTVVGPCYIPQLSHGEAVLGPLPHGWKMMFHISGEPYFVGPDNTPTLQDPRVNEGLPPGWKQSESEKRTRLLWKKKRHGYWQMDDPRTTPERLKARGIKLEVLTVV